MLKSTFFSIVAAALLLAYGAIVNAANIHTCGIDRGRASLPITAKGSPSCTKEPVVFINRANARVPAFRLRITNGRCVSGCRLRQSEASRKRGFTTEGPTYVCQWTPEKLNATLTIKTSTCSD